MKLRSFGLWSTTAIAAALITTPAFAKAKAQPVPPPPPPNASAQTSAGTEPTTSTETNTATNQAAADQTIVVTGLRASLQSSRNIRKNSQQIVDSVVA
jgi:hypothetical protein